MPRFLPTQVANHELLTPEQRSFLGSLELPPALYQKWGEFLAGLLGSLVDGYHAGTDTPDWQARGRELYDLYTRDWFTAQDRAKGREYLAICIAGYKPVRVLELLMRCDVLNREREKAAAEARENARRSQLPLGNAA